MADEPIVKLVFLRQQAAQAGSRKAVVPLVEGAEPLEAVSDELMGSRGRLARRRLQRKMEPEVEMIMGSIERAAKAQPGEPTSLLEDPIGELEGRCQVSIGEIHVHTSEVQAEI